MEKTVEEFDVDQLLENVLEKQLVVYNDDYHTFDWVILCLMEVLEHSLHQAEQCTIIIHNKGKCSVKVGSYDELKPYREALVERGLKTMIE
jgi:ATP-dependent Clp protease adaptor protein ClpS